METPIIETTEPQPNKKELKRFIHLKSESSSQKRFRLAQTDLSSFRYEIFFLYSRFS